MDILNEQILRAKELMGLLNEQEEVSCNYDSFKDKTRLKSSQYGNVKLFENLYEAGFNEVDKEYKGCWYRKDFTFGDYIFENSGGVLPKSPGPISMKLVSKPTELENSYTFDNTSDEQEEYIKSHTTLGYDIGGRMNVVPASNDEGMMTFIFDSSGNIVEPEKFYEGLQKLK